MKPRSPVPQLNQLTVGPGQSLPLARTIVFAAVPSLLIVFLLMFLSARGYIRVAIGAAELLLLVPIVFMLVWAVVLVSWSIRSRSQQHLGAMSSSPHDRLRGQVSGFLERSEGTQAQEIIWAFRVDVYDADGDLVRRVPVELRGTSFKGAIRDGDTVEIPGRWQAGQTFHAREVFNVTTQTTVGPKQVSPLVRIAVIAGCIAFLVVFLLVFLGFLGVGAAVFGIFGRR